MLDSAELEYGCCSRGLPTEQVIHEFDAKLTHAEQMRHALESALARRAEVPTPRCPRAPSAAEVPAAVCAATADAINRCFTDEHVSALRDCALPQEQAAAAQQLAAVEAQWAARLEDLRERHKVSRKVGILGK